MPTVLLIRYVRVVIYPNDHAPPHVHAVQGNEARAKFHLNCPQGPVEQIGFRLGEAREILAAIAENLPDICARWRAIHG
jgi:hypothetical protein